MSEAVDIYINTTSHESSEATEFDFELFERFVSGGPWVAHSEYMKLKAENAKLREQGARLFDKTLELGTENAKLRELLHRLLVEYRYLRVRPRKMYLQHEARMRAIEEEMRDLGVEVDG